MTDFSLINSKLLEKGLMISQDYSLAQFCTYKVGGVAKLFCEISEVTQLEILAEAVNNYDLNVLVIGKGSNILISDSGFDGLVIKLGNEFDYVKFEGLQVLSGGNTFLPVLSRKSVQHSLTGLEWAVGVPGSVGGSVRMNAGGHGSDISESLISASIFDMKISSNVVMTSEELGLSYRSSNLKPYQLVLSATFLLEHGDSEKSQEELSKIVKWRRANQPGGQNAGSVFANPEGEHAARLIEECGLKGYRVGSAMVSQKHANFIQADPDGKANDIYELIRFIQSTVKDKTGYDLRVENKLIGFE